MTHWNLFRTESLESNQRAAQFLNPFCTVKCVNNIIDGKLQCNCADSGFYDWKWVKEGDTCAVLSQNNSKITFHPVYSSGTAAVRGEAPLAKNKHHFWEMKMLSHLYGTDIMVGVGTNDIQLSQWRHRFFSLLGSDKRSWGYSYNGLIQHNGVMVCYGSSYGLGSLIGVHVDMCRGTLEFFLNRKPLGMAFEGLKSVEIFPMICSTAAQSAMKMTCATSFDTSLQLICLQNVIRDPRLYKRFKEIPGLARIYENHFSFMLPKDS